MILLFEICVGHFIIFVCYVVDAPTPTHFESDLAASNQPNNDCLV